eukprot:gene10785-16841_t
MTPVMVATCVGVAGKKKVCYQRTQKQNGALHKACQKLFATGANKGQGSFAFGDHYCSDEGFNDKQAGKGLKIEAAPNTVPKNTMMF